MTSDHFSSLTMEDATRELLQVSEVPVETSVTAWAEHELLRFAKQTEGTVGSDVKLPSTSNGREVSKTWYKNWIIHWTPQSDSTLDTRALSEDGSFWRTAREKFGDVAQMVQTYCQDWEDTPLDIITFFFCLAAFSNPQYHKSKPATCSDKFLWDSYYFSHFAFAAYRGSKKGGIYSFLLVQLL